MISLAGHRYGTAVRIAHALGPDMTAARVRDWARRSRRTGDRLHGLLPAHHLPGLPGQGRGTTGYHYDQAAHVEMLTRVAGRVSKRMELGYAVFNGRADSCG